MNVIYFIMLQVVILGQVKCHSPESRSGLELGEWSRCTLFTLEHCHCRSDTDNVVREVNCTDSHFRDTLPLKNMPATVDKVIFTGNKIGDLEPLFGNCVKTSKKPLEVLRVLDISRNEIHTVHDDCFACVPHVHTLNLSNNQWHVNENTHVFNSQQLKNLQELDMTAAFSSEGNELDILFGHSNLPSLEKLHLKDNMLLSFSAQSLCSLTSLTVLDLSDNHISEVAWNNCLQGLKELYLRNNLLSNISEVFIKQLDLLKLRVLDISSNPYTCNNETKVFYDWLNSSRSDYVSNKSKLMCTYPTEYYGIPILSLDKSVFGSSLIITTQPVMEKFKQKSHVTAITTGIVLVVLALIVIIILVVYQSRIKSTCNRHMSRRNYVYEVMYI